jgi:hypothetical protein
MPFSVANALRKQASECLRVARSTADNAVRNELLAAAAWLHEEAVRIEGLVQRGGRRDAPTDVDSGTRSSERAGRSHDDAPQIAE